MDVLGAVHIPRLDLEQNGPLDLPGTGRITQPVEQGRIVINHAGVAPELDASATGEIHQKDERPGVLRQITKRDVLAIAAEVGKAQSLLIPGSTNALPANLFNKTNPVEHHDMMQPKVHQQRRPRAIQANSRTRSPRTPDRHARDDCEQQG